METVREPVVYVKGARTFGDKTSPAMAQIALRKTVEEKQGGQPGSGRGAHKEFLHGSVATVAQA